MCVCVRLCVRVCVYVYGCVRVWMCEFWSEWGWKAEEGRRDVVRYGGVGEGDKRKEWSRERDVN